MVPKQLEKAMVNRIDRQDSTSNWPWSHSFLDCYPALSIGYCHIRCAAQICYESAPMDVMGEAVVLNYDNCGGTGDV